MKVLELCKDRESYVLIFAPDDKLSFRNHVSLVSRLICTCRGAASGAGGGVRIIPYSTF